jgi:hypothetical protein
MDNCGPQSSVASSCMNHLTHAWITAVHNRQWPHHVWITQDITHGTPRRTISSGLIMYEMQHHTWNTAAHYHKWPHHACNTTAYMAAGTVHICHAFRCAATHTRAQQTTTTIKPQNLHHHTQLQLTLAALSRITSCTANCMTSHMVLGILCSSLRLKARLPHAAPTTQKAYQQLLLVQLLCHILVLCPHCVPPLACLVTPLKLQTYGSSMSHGLHQYLHHVNHHVASSSSSMENVVCLRRRSRFNHVSKHPREILVIHCELHVPRPCRTPITKRWSDQARSSPRAVTPPTVHRTVRPQTKYND